MSRTRWLLAVLVGVLITAACSGGEEGRTALVPVDEVAWENTTYPPGTCGYQRVVTVTDGRWRPPESTEYDLDYSESFTPIVEVEEVGLVDLVGDRGREAVVTLQCSGHEWSHREVLVYESGPSIRFVFDRIPCPRAGWDCIADGEILGPPEIDGNHLVMDLLWVAQGGDGIDYGTGLRARFAVAQQALVLVSAEAILTESPMEVTVSPVRSLFLALREGWDVSDLAPPLVTDALVGSDAFDFLPLASPIVFGPQEPFGTAEGNPQGQSTGAHPVWEMRVQQERPDGSTISRVMSYPEGEAIVASYPVEPIDSAALSR